MSTRYFILLCTLSAGLMAACQSSPYASSNNTMGEPAIDGLSRNITQTQGGAIRDPMTLSPPPVRPTPSARPSYAQER